MIKLTVNPHTTPSIHRFYQQVITIGSGIGSEIADLSLSDPSLQSIHIKIIQEEHRSIILNLASDPFVTLNNLPFGRKILKANDILQIGPHTILIGIEETSASINPTEADICFTNPASVVEASLQKKERPSEELPRKNLFSENLPIEPKNQKIEIGAQENLLVSSPTTLLPTIEKPDEKKTVEETLSSSPTFLQLPEEEKKTAPAIPPAKKHLYEYHVGEFDDESEHWNLETDETIEHGNEPTESFIHWKMIGMIVLAVLLIGSVVSSIFYFNINAKIDEEELRAAEGIADIAMALKYAQIQHIKSPKKNWSDPEFIQNVLTQVIPHDYLSLAKIDAQGHLTDTSYALRIYTSTDFSQFLVIAQPAPTVFQWLLPKTAIVIDSKIMQLRKVPDIKTLNRLLVNSNNLDNSNAKEVTQLVKRGELMPLSKLANNHNSQEFSPPKALSLMRPGAENYIYNAPRYYQLSETIMRRAIELMEIPGSLFEMSRLKQDMALLAKMNDMILYSSDGIQLTLNAQKAIAAFVSNARFLTAYLKFNSEGQIISSHLIIDDEGAHYNEAQKIQSPSPQPPPIEKELEPLAVAEMSTESKRLSSEESIPSSETAPLLAKLMTLCKTRKNQLTPLKNQILTLLEGDVNRPIDAEFESHLKEKIGQYLEIDHQQKLAMAEGIHHLAEEYQLMSIDDFVSYLNQAGLGGCHAILKHLVQTDSQNEKILTDLIASVQQVENFIAFDKILNFATQWLVVKNFSDLNQLQAYEKLIKNEAISRINQLLLSSAPLPLSFTYDHEQLLAFHHLLQLLLENPDEQNYYLSEFEQHKKKEE